MLAIITQVHKYNKEVLETLSKTNSSQNGTHGSNCPLSWCYLISILTTAQLSVCVKCTAKNIISRGSHFKLQCVPGPMVFIGKSEKSTEPLLRGLGKYVNLVHTGMSIYSVDRSVYTSGSSLMASG